MDQREDRITQLYEKALSAMKRYSSYEEYLSAEPGARKLISIHNLTGFVDILQHEINKYECCIDDIERARVGTELLYWCRSVAQYDCVEEDVK